MIGGSGGSARSSPLDVGVDAWGDLTAVGEFAARETMRRLDEEERVAGHAQWVR